MTHYLKHLKFKELSIVLEEYYDKDESSDYFIETCRTQSVHLSYYSIVQLIQHIVTSNTSYENSDEIKFHANELKKSYHTVLFSLLKDVLMSSGNWDNNFKQNYYGFLNLRAKADYSIHFVETSDLVLSKQYYNYLESKLIRTK